jgi:hypothetical protein
MLGFELENRRGVGFRGGCVEFWTVWNLCRRLWCEGGGG